VKTSPEDLRRQFDLDRKIADGLHRDHDALQQAHSVAAQLKSLSGNNPSAEIAKAIGDAQSKVDSIAGSSGGYGATYLSTPEGRTLARLNSGFGSLLSALDSADAAPTTQQQAMFAELDNALAGQLAAWEQFKSKDLPALNETLKKAGHPTVDTQKPLAAGSDSGEEGDED
jgi:hypothetical protein